MRREKEREYREALESRDLLAMAEAILMGKDLDELVAPATLEELELGTRVVNALKNNEVLTPQQLANLAATGQDALLALAGIGPKAVEEITAALEAISLQLQPAEAEATVEAVAEEKAPVAEAIVNVVEEKEEGEPAAEELSEVIEKAETLIAETPPTEETPTAEVELPTEAAEEKPALEEAPAETEETVTTVVDEEKPTIFRIVDAWDGEEEELPEEKQRAKKKRKRLVYDEELGEVVARRKRKPGRQREDWEDYD
jgi:hypothetical protein